jgi:hypothetical protein
MCKYRRTSTRIKARFPGSSKNSSHEGIAQLLRQLDQTGLLDFDGLVSELDRRDAVDFRRLLGNAGMSYIR